jgi:hypothetical protein
VVSALVAVSRIKNALAIGVVTTTLSPCATAATRADECPPAALLWTRCSSSD